jgi:site-specific recombinase XerD
MGSFNVRGAMEEILRQMEQNGAREEQLRHYRCTNLGAVIRYFNQRGITEVTSEMLDEFVLEQRKCYEQGAFSNWKWISVRRGSELLKHYAKTGTVEMVPLRPWEPVLRKPRQSVEKDLPSPEQLADSNSIFALVWRIKQELLRLGLTERTVRHYTTEGLTPILRAHSKQGLEYYSPSLANEMVLERRRLYEQGLASRVAYQDLRKAAVLLSEMHQTGKITLSPIPSWGLRYPTPVFAALLQDFCNNAKRTGVLAASTIKTAKSAIRIFLFELEDCGIQSFEQVTLAVVSSCVTTMAKRYKGGTTTAMFCVRIFLKHLHESGTTPIDFSLAIPEMIARRKVVREGFSRDEIGRLLNTPNRETAIGKRDYAIMLLAAQTGLRAVDVVNLKRQDINWRTYEIHIVQQKTSQPLILPLEPECGNAIADYLLHWRPVCDLPYIFLCHVGALRPIDNRSASAIVTKHMRRAEMISPIPRRGFHSFRRAFGTRLLQSETSLDLLRQLLGLVHIDSAKPYLSVDEQGLKDCALVLIPLGKAGEQ